MPVSVGVNSKASETMKLSKAILLYTGARSSYATVNDVLTSADGTVQIGVGKAATSESVGELAKLLVNNVRMGGYLPETVLSVGLSSVVWWCKPQKRRRIWFKTSNDQLGTRSGETAHPGLVFSVSEEGWSVWAVKGNKRPTPETKLYQAPYFNVWKGGRICTGNILCPDAYTHESLMQWEEAFFGTFFTHPNVHAPDKLVDFDGGSHAFWKSQLDSTESKFPEIVLVSAKITLAGLLERKDS